MTLAPWTLDHVAHAVRNIDSALKLYTKTFGFSLVAREQLALDRVDVAFVQCGASLIELIAPLDGQSPVHKFIEKRGEGLHHLAYRVTDINAELARLAANGFRLIDSQARPGARGKLVAFIHPTSTTGVLVELCGGS